MSWHTVVPKTQTDARRVPGITKPWVAARRFLAEPTPRWLMAWALFWGALRLTAGPLGWGDALVGLGIALYWPLQEWAAHATILHLRPRQIGPWRIDPLFARMHRWHHAHPHVIERIFVPFPVVVALTPVHALLWWALAPTWATALTGLAAFTTATLLYEAVHYLSHVPVAPGNAYLKAVRKHHALHHFRNEHYWFAFTVPWIDRWLGTAPREGQAAPRSPTVRTLGVEDDWS